MQPLNTGDTLELYGETVLVSKVQILDDTQLIFWHSQNSPLCGLQVKTSQSQQNITFNLS